MSSYPISDTRDSVTARVQAVAAFGFTERQARFLVTVIVHAGFLERQYCTFTGTVRGHNSRESLAYLSPEVALGERSPRARLQVLLELRCARLVRQFDGGDELPWAQRRRVHGPATVVCVQPLLHVARDSCVIPRRTRDATEDVDDLPVAHHDASGCKVSATDNRAPNMGCTGRGRLIVQLGANRSCRTSNQLSRESKERGCA
jgi:hypothetical protein